MKIIIPISLLALLSSCQSYGDPQGRWNEMYIDMALRHKYEKYSCGYRSIHGYSKESCAHKTVRHHCIEIRTQPREIPVNTNSGSGGNQTAQASYNEIEALSGRISAMEEDMKTNVSTTNQNQQVIVNQINELKERLAELQNKPTPPVAAHAGSGIKIPGE